MFYDGQIWIARRRRFRDQPDIQHLASRRELRNRLRANLGRGVVANYGESAFIDSRLSAVILFRYNFRVLIMLRCCRYQLPKGQD